MLSIQAFNHLLQRDTERPFKAYPRPSVSLPASSLYPGFPAQSFASSHHLPHNLSADSTKRRHDLAALSPTSSYVPPATMDFRHSVTQGYEASLMHEMNTGGGPPRMSNHDPSCHVKSEMENMACTTAMTSHGLSQGAHGYPSVSSMHSIHPGLTPHHVMPGTSNGTSNGTESGSSMPHSNKHTSASATLGSSSGGDSPSLPSGDSSPMSNHGGSKMPPKKRPLSVPEDMKDMGYWEKRKKNNESAKRSREARRMKEEQIAMRVVYLEQENLQLRTEVSLLKSEIEKLRCMLYNS